MKLEEAIEILESCDRRTSGYPFRTFTDAVELGIQALKHLQYERDRRIGFWTDPIPGETKE